MKRIKTAAVATALVALSLSATACKPYDKPEFVVIEPNQTAFVVPMTGKTSDQGQFQSVDFLKKSQVATKRIEVTHEWVKTGRNPWYTLGLREKGKYMDNVRVIVVDRTPETREWKDGLSFVGESRDSIKFNQGMSATAQILEEDTATFLYQYAGKSLKDVMDSEIRNKVGSVLLEKYSTMAIDDIRSDKSSIIQQVRKEVEPYFKQRGITLSNIGYIGDIKYLQEDIQTAINKKFKEEQEKAAQDVLNQKAIEKAAADIQVAQKEAQAAASRQATLQTQIRLKELENEAAWIQKWDGKQPSTVVNGDTSGTMLNISK